MSHLPEIMVDYSTSDTECRGQFDLSELSINNILSQEDLPFLTAEVNRTPEWVSASTLSNWNINLDCLGLATAVAVVQLIPSWHRYQLQQLCYFI